MAAWRSRRLGEARPERGIAGRPARRCGAPLLLRAALKVVAAVASWLGDPARSELLQRSATFALTQLHDEVEEVAAEAAHAGPVDGRQKHPSQPLRLRRARAAREIREKLPPQPLQRKLRKRKAAMEKRKRLPQLAARKQAKVERGGTARPPRMPRDPG